MSNNQRPLMHPLHSAGGKERLAEHYLGHAERVKKYPGMIPVEECPTCCKAVDQGLIVNGKAV